MNPPDVQAAPRQKAHYQPITVEAKAMSNSDQFTNDFKETTVGNFANQLSGNASQQATQNINSAPTPPAGDMQLADDAKTILFLASNPKKTGQLRLSEELREIDESLRRAECRSQFDLKNKGAVRTRDFSRALLESNPQIVHFSGHGVGTVMSEASCRDGSDGREISLDPASEEGVPQGLLFENETGHAKLITSEHLADVFELFADQVECVVLNACYSQAQADAIARHIPYVIGMSRPISDRGAIEFAIAFYDAIGAGRDIEFAFKLARTHLTPFGEKDIPKLLKCSGQDG